MSKILVDTSYPEETRIAIIDAKGKLSDFHNELQGKEALKGNIYLAKVTRVEPSLQAAFVDYGPKKQGFLAFSEIHADYYRIPVADRENIDPDSDNDFEESEKEEGEREVEEVGGEDVDDEVRAKGRHKRSVFAQRYKIQEVIKKDQLILVQVVKEERGNKGAALSSYISLAGRYCVLMPNSYSSGGISRRVKNAEQRKRMKMILKSLAMTEGMSIILRTASIQRTKVEIQRDFKYLIKLWDGIREKTLKATAPALIHEEANLIMRTIRDVYDKTVEEVVVSTRDAWKNARSFMKVTMPSHASRVVLYDEKEAIPIFQKHNVESQISDIYRPVITLPSGGYIVIQQTEALVSIDVNSGKATRERHIEETAFQTNMEAAIEVARQLRLRDLAGLVVVDFIDMENYRKNHQLEQCFKEALNLDRARIQMGKVTSFGLLELSRQRLSASVFDSTTISCTVCDGAGYIMSDNALIMKALRCIEQKIIELKLSSILIKLPPSAGMLFLNEWRNTLASLEERHQVQIRVETHDLPESSFQIFSVVQHERKDEKRESVALLHPLKIYDSQQKPVTHEHRKRAIHNYAEGNKEAGDEKEKPSNRRGSRGGAGRRRGRYQEKNASVSQSSSDIVENDNNKLTAEAAQTPAPENNKKQRYPKKSIKTAEVQNKKEAVLQSQKKDEALPTRKRRTVRRRKPTTIKKKYPSATEIVEVSESKPKPIGKRNWLRRII